LLAAAGVSEPSSIIHLPSRKERDGGTRSRTRPPATGVEPGTEGCSLELMTPGSEVYRKATKPTDEALRQGRNTREDHLSKKIGKN
jgi:hypothetical protein